MSDKEVDTFSGVETTGHEWDGITELNNPLPRWWLWTWYATIAFSLGYVIYYPAIPLISSYTQGISGETTRSVVEKDLAAAEQAKSGMVQKILDTPLEEIRTDDALFRFATAGGQSLYKVYCTQCHGSGAQGAPGFPNLNDDDWLWGGDLETIYTTIAHGVRNDEDDDARFSDMMAFGEDDMLSGTEIVAVSEFVRKISGQEHNADNATTGIEIFADNCAACHGDDGLGGRDLGAPNLGDALWLYGGSLNEIATQIRTPKHGVMPAWLGRLGEASVKQLTVYIHSLGGGEKELASAE
ncbi:MAG: cytochrome-c oxidase, cbb3-type subunit III [Hyphomicrobiales bacterium]|nr:cytochrome-c oxidase, cbb3-type subunit III [Hyphomicrobiales bacterium]PCJ86761.1 MAG: cytochrome-c oxidase, cbb3-type subunit III [Hyphomicrobiales bacterium]